MDAPAIATQGLTRRFGELVAVQDVNLSVAAGQFFGFLGPNGAGKSTTIKMLTGLLSASSGSIQILGLDLAQNPVEVKRQIGVVPEGMARVSGSAPRLPMRMTLLMPRAMVNVLRVFLSEAAGRRVAPAAENGFILVEVHGEREPHLCPECASSRAAQARAPQNG